MTCAVLDSVSVHFGSIPLTLHGARVLKEGERDLTGRGSL
jgi:hypothetical protein